MRVHRLIHILIKIESQGKVKARDLAEELEVSHRTIYRDIEILCEVGYPIVTTTGQNGGIAFWEGYKLNLEQTEDTLKTLIAHMYAMPEQERLIQALENGMDLKYAQTDSVSDKKKQKILIDKKSWWEESSAEIDLQPIMKALFLQKKVVVEYIQGDGRKSDRILAPYGLVLKHTAWYLAAYCYTKQGIRTFKCSRINRMTLLQDSYEIPDDFKLKSYWNLSVKMFKESKKESEYYPVEIILQESFLTIFENYDVIGIKKVGDLTVGMIDLHRKDVAEEEIRAFLCYGQILYPEEMRIRAIEVLENSIRKYK